MENKPLQAYLLELIEESGLDTPANTLLAQARTAGYMNCEKSHVYAAKNAAKKGVKPSPSAEAKPRKPRAAKVQQAEAADDLQPSGDFANLKAAAQELQSRMRALGIDRVVVTLNECHIPLV